LILGFSIVYLAVEDKLSEVVGRSLINYCLGSAVHTNLLMRNGFGYLKSNIRKFNEIARTDVVLLITDLDAGVCAPSLIRDWCTFGNLESQFLFRVAVREIESWIIADQQGLANYFGIPSARISRDPENLADPKREIIRLASRASKDIRMDITPKPNSGAVQGLGYNERLSDFVSHHWDIRSAVENSRSLDRAVNRISLST
jgi:hypothetical protein